MKKDAAGPSRIGELRTPFVLFIALAVSGGVCAELSTYEQEIRDLKGPIRISTHGDINICRGYDDSPDVLCLPVLSFSEPVNRLEIVSSGETVLSATCFDEAPDCLTRFSCEACYAGDWKDWDGGAYMEDRLSCFISYDLFTPAETKACTNIFTATAWTSTGKSGSITFLNSFKQKDPDWGP